MSKLEAQPGLLHQIISDAEQELNRLNPTPFSPTGFLHLKEKIGEHIAQLITESVKISRRHQSDTVSASHVQRASEYLISSTSRRIFRHLGTAGGILLGASISNFLSMTTVNQYTSRGIITSAVLGIIGAFLVALHMAKD